MLTLLAAATAFTAPVPAMDYDWFSGIYDWPKNGIKQNELVIVQVDVTVNPHGYIEGCEGHVRAGIPQLGPYVCGRLRMRGEFDPARDGENRRTYGIYRTAVVLWNGDSKDFPKKPGVTDFTIVNSGGAKTPIGDSLVIQFAVDTQGKPSMNTCSAVRTLGYGLNRTKQSVDPALVAQACAELSLKMKLEPARNPSGRAVPSVQSANVEVISRK